MEERNKNNNQKLRDIFRKLNKESQPADNQWNVPSDELWGKIATEVQAEKPKRRGWLWSLLAVLFLVGSGIGLYYVLDSDKVVDGLEKNSTITEMDSKEASESNAISDLSVAPLNSTTVEKNESVVNDKTEKTSSAPINSSDKNVVSSTVGVSTGKKLKSTENIVLSSERNTSNTTSIRNTIALNNTDTEQVSKLDQLPNSTNVSIDAKSGAASKSNAPVNSTSEQSADTQSEMAESKVDASLGSLSTLPALPSLIAIAKNSRLQIKVIPKADDNTTASKELDWSFPTVMIGAYYNPSVSYNSIKGDQPSIIVGNQNGFNLKNFGIRAEAMLSKNIAFEIGVQRSTYNLRADYNIVFPYLNTGEQTNSEGDFDSEFSHNLPSPTGEVQTLMALTRLADHDVPNGEEVNVTYIMDQKLDFVSVPITLKYYINADKPFAVSVRAGLLKHFRLRSNSLITDFQSHHDAIQYRHSDAQADVQFINKSNTSLMAGIGLNYRTEKGFHFFVEPSFTKAVIPMFSGSFENRPYTYEVNVGLSYRLIK